MRGDGKAMAAAVSALASWSVRNRRAVLVAVGLLTAMFSVAAFVGLKPSANTEDLVPKAASASAATNAIRSKFGDDAIVVLAQADLAKLLLSPDLGRLLALEGCLGGRVPKGAKVYGGSKGPCARIAATGYVQRVYGPATFLNEAASQISDQVSVELKAAIGRVQSAEANARKAALAKGLGTLAANAAAQAAGVAAQKDAAAALTQLQVQTGIKGLPSIANSDFVSGIVFDPGKGPGYPKTRFSYLFPSSNSALIQVRPKPGLTGSQRRELIGLVRAATDQRLFKLSSGSYIVTGAPVLAESLADQVAAGALPLLLLAMLVMAAVLALAFRVSFRLLPLLLALSAAAGVFGAMGLLGIPLTVAAVGGVPVLIGLAVDYAVQFQSRVSERASGGADADEALVSAAGVGGPPLVAAALATTAGFLALLASPVPMVRGFGLALIAGVALALLLSFTLGSALISVRIESKDALSRIADRLDDAASDARQILARAPGREQIGAARRSTGLLLSRKPGAVLIVALVLAVGGWVADSGVGVDSDITRLVPSGTPALRDLQTLQRESGIAGEVDVMLTGAKATDPTTLAWLRDFNSRALRNFGYSEQRGCSGGAELCPGVSITDLVGPVATTAQAQAALAVLPEYFRNAVVTSDNQSVLSAFGVSLLPLERQQQIFDYLKAEAAKAPAGVTAQVGSLSVIAAEANSSLADPISRWKITLLALAAVALVLLLTLRSFARAAVPLAATVIATGWAALGLWVFGIELNPISAALGALVIAIATEFAVLLSERQYAELRSGDDAEAALGRALGTTGRAIVVSGSTVVAGFAVLGFSDIRVLRDFGLATVVNLSLALAAVAVVVPALVRSRARRGSDPASGPQSEKAQVD